MEDPLVTLGAFAADLAERCYYTDFYRPFTLTISNFTIRRRIMMQKNVVKRAAMLIEFCLTDATRASALLNYVKLENPHLWEDLHLHGPQGPFVRTQEHFDFVEDRDAMEYKVLRKKLGRFLPNIFPAVVAMWERGLLTPQEYAQILMRKDCAQKVINHLRLIAPRIEKHQARSMNVIAACFNPKDPVPPDYDPESMFRMVPTEQRRFQ